MSIKNHLDKSHNSLEEIQGGTVSEHYHLTSDLYNVTSSLSVNGGELLFNGSTIGGGSGTSDHTLLSNLNTSTYSHVTSTELRGLGNLMSTGLVLGGALTVNVDPAKINLALGYGVIVDNYTNPQVPTKTPIAWDALSAITLTYLADNDETAIGVNSSGSVVQSPTQFDDIERRDIIPLGTIGHPSRTSVDYVLIEPVVITDMTAQFMDFMESFGAFNIEGNEFSPNGANLYIDKSAGKTFDAGSNYSHNIKTPNIHISDPFVSALFAYYHRDNTGEWIQLNQTATIDPNNYDTGLGLSAVPEGKWTIQPVFYYAPLDHVSFNVDIQYGQILYDSKENAKSAITDVISVNPFLQYNTFRSWIVIQQGATVLNDPATCEFITAGKLGLVSAASGGGVGGEINSVSNIGTEGVGLYDSKLGIDCRIRKVVGKNNLVVVANDNNKTVEISAENLLPKLSGTATNLKESKQLITTAVTTLVWGQHVEINYAGNIDLSTGGITDIPSDDTEAFMVITQHHLGGLRSITWGETQPIGGLPTARGTTYTVYCLRPSAVAGNENKYFLECVGGR